MGNILSRYDGKFTKHDDLVTSSRKKSFLKRFFTFKSRKSFSRLSVKCAKKQIFVPKEDEHILFEDEFEHGFDNISYKGSDKAKLSAVDFMPSFASNLVKTVPRQSGNILSRRSLDGFLERIKRKQSTLVGQQSFESTTSLPARLQKRNAQVQNQTSDRECKNDKISVREEEIETLFESEKKTSAESIKIEFMALDIDSPWSIHFNPNMYRNKVRNATMKKKLFFESTTSLPDLLHRRY